MGEVPMYGRTMAHGMAIAKKNDIALNLKRLLYRNVQWLRCGLVCKAKRLVYHSTPGLRVRTKKEGLLRRGYD